ncbi:MAG: DNA topoisomerase I [Promethearchaeota archaeon]
MKRLVHNGIRVIELSAPTGLTLTVRGNSMVLNALQEQMAMAFIAKRHLGYWEDHVFVRNFLRDFSKTLGVKPALKPDEINLEKFFREAIVRREREQHQKEIMTKEERKALAAERKTLREALREEYGYAEIDNEQVEIANWTAEPSCIFMGRGEHPLRGRWKWGPKQEDITLNLSPDAPMPEGNWAGRVWQPENLWIARWEDKLFGKMKYVWVSDTASIKQDREVEKFAVAQQLAKRIKNVRQAIQADMKVDDPLKRQIATACYLIDVLSLRMGDEKDPDEADTVGATTLRPEHVTIKDNGEVEFQFLGKDSVPWHKTVELPTDVVEELHHLVDNARVPTRGKRQGRRHPSSVQPQIFPDVNRLNVNAYLNEIMSGLTAKVFRTYHASSTVRSSLGKARVKTEDPNWKKKNTAKRANLEAAIVCNHTKQEPKGWPKRMGRFRERKRRANERITKAEENLTNCQARLKDLTNRQKVRIEQLKEQGKPIPIGKKRPYASSISAAQKSIKTAKLRLTRAQEVKDKLNAEIALARNTRTWNLGTSLKSYIDPRIYRDWGRQIDYDWKDFYPTTLQRKFAWIDKDIDVTDS